MSNRPLVLVPLDRATSVERTIRIACSAARARGADVHVIQVVPERARRGADNDAAAAAHDHVAFEAALRLAAQPARGDGVWVQRVVLRGAPEHVIPAYALLHQTTLLVVERDYGSSPLWRNGRVVADLARRSAVPLLVLQAVTGPEPAARPFHRIVAPIDFSVASAVALRTAVDIARRHGARVTLLHALTDALPHMAFSAIEALDAIDQLPADIAETEERLRRKAAFFGAEDVDTEVATGDADAAILDVAARQDADLIVMGIPHRSWLDRLLRGSILQRVLREATVPVLVVPVVAGAHDWPSFGRRQTRRGAGHPRPSRAVPTVSEPWPLGYRPQAALR